MQCMRVAIRQVAPRTPFASNAALLHTSEDRLGSRLFERVDKDAAGLELERDLLSFGDICAPDTGAKAS